MKTRVCSVCGCGLVYHAIGLCKKHYKAEWRLKNISRIRIQKSAYHLKHRKEILGKQATYYAANKGRAKRRFDSWVKVNRQRYNAHQAKWRKDHPEKCAAKEGRRRAEKFSATPAWANSFFISEIYDLAKLRTKVTGFEWHVDHIVPLKSDLVCGLHVENNLRVIPAVQNIAKCNRYWPDMPT